MKRWLLLIPLTLLPAMACKFHSDVKIPKTLEKTLKQYWQYRCDKHFDKSYSYELPYLDFLHTKKWYENFFANQREFKKIEVKKVAKKRDDVVIMGILLYPSKGHDPIFLYDKWIKLDKKWYHKYDDRPLPNF